MRIAIDIETIQASKEEWAALQGIDLAHENDDKLSLGQEQSQLEKEHQKSIFDATFSRIICIGMIVLNDDMTPGEAVAWHGPNERELLRQFWSRMSVERPKLIITYNGLGFDLPFIKKRSIIHQVKPTLEISLAKYRTEPVYDIMAVWANWENRSFIKLDVLTRALGVEAKSGSGAEVAELWAHGKGEAIAEYCLQDVYVTYACYCRMTYREPIKSSVVLAKKNLHHIG